MINRVIPVALIAVIAGCTVAPKTTDLSNAGQPQSSSEEGDFDPANSAGTARTDLQPFASARLASLAARIYEDPDAVPFADFWSAYLESSKIHTAVVDRENFRAAVENFPEGECADFNWEKWTRQNFFELEPHLSAQDCYEQAGELTKAEREARAVQYILRGILGSGDGESIDSAYEIGILDHAEDILHLAGYRLMDSFLLPVRDGMGLYYVLQVEDPESGLQRQIYFENQRAIHRILDVEYPFAGIDNLYVTHMLEPLAERTIAAITGLGIYHETQGNIEQAVSHLMDAAAYDSQVAQYRLGRLCLVREDLEMFSRGDCVDFLLSAAEQGHVESMITLAYIYREGIGVEASEDLGRQFLRAAEQRLEPGLAQLRFAYHYAGDKLVVDPEVEMEYIRKAAAQGQMDAQYLLLRRAHGDWWEAEPGKFLPELSKLAEQGYRPAALAYARRVFNNIPEHSEGELARAREFLDGALSVNSRTAHMLQGKLLQSGLLGQRDFAAAESHYMQSPLHTDSQIGMGRLHGQQRLADSDPQVAALWYMMCASHEVPECLYQLGRLFRSGEGVKRDPNLAIAMFAQAAHKGHKLAMAEVEKLEAE